MRFLYFLFISVLTIALTFTVSKAESGYEDTPEFIPHNLPNYNKAGSFSLHLNTFFLSGPNTISVPTALRATYTPVNNFSVGLMTAHYKFKQTQKTENGTKFYDDVQYRHFFGGIHGTFFITDFLHNHFGLKIHPDYFNIYVNAYLGYGKAIAVSGGNPDEEFINSVSSLGKGVTIGFRSLFTDTIGFFAEGGYTEYGYIQAGVSFLIIK